MTFSDHSKYIITLFSFACYAFWCGYVSDRCSALMPIFMYLLIDLVFTITKTPLDRILKKNPKR
jgi:hypothetical protein